MKLFGQDTALLPDDQKLFDQLLLEQGSEYNVFPLSFAQHRLWFFEQLDPGTALYHLPIALRIRGPLAVDVLEHCLRATVARHEALRTVFSSVGGNPMQQVLEDMPLRLPVIDLRAIEGAGERGAEARRRLEQAAAVPFDLERGPLFRPYLLTVGDQEHLLLLAQHHIISDGWSCAVLIQEIEALYQAIARGQASPLPELAIQYPDFAVWQRQMLTPELLETQLGYWGRQLEGLAELELPTDRARSAATSHRGAHLSFELPRSSSEALQAVASEAGSTLFAALLGAFQILLQRYSGQSDIVVGAPMANRGRSELEGLVGFFINTVALRVEVDEDLSFRQFLGRVHRVTAEAYAHQDLPFERLVEELVPDRDLGQNPLFRVMLAMQSAPQGELAAEESPSNGRGPEKLNEKPAEELTLEPFEVEVPASKFDLTWAISETSAGWTGFFEYKTDLFEVTTIQRLGGHLHTLLGSIAENPGARLGELSMLGAAERFQILREWSEVPGEAPAGQCLHQRMTAHAVRAPAALAVVGSTEEGQSLTYGELEERAQRWAHRLRLLGVGPEVPVGLCVEPDIELALGVFGILKAGGLYLPLDPAYPKERLQWMLADAGVTVVLTQRRLLETLEVEGVTVLCLDDAPVDSELASGAEAPELRARPENPSHIIYTSGSTGKPKGICCSHRAAFNLISAMDRWRPLEPGEVCSAWSNISFDASIYELFTALCFGGVLHLATTEMRSDSEGFLDWLGERKIHSAFVPAFVLEDLAGRLEADPGQYDLRRILVGVEPIPIELLERIQRALPDLKIVNGYGPAEATVCPVVYSLPGPSSGLTGRTPIGRPLKGLLVHLLDAEGRPVPAGVPGEVCLGGIGLARGYWRRPGLTAEKFVPNPFATVGGERLYKTGDQACYLADGNVKFLGRLDHQVKLRGFRIEPGEIEATLVQHPAVDEAVVLLRTLESIGKQLVAFVGAGESSGADSGELRRWLEARLPAHMIPAAFVVMASLPVTPNGKLDRKALGRHEVVIPTGQSEEAALRSATEELLAGIWAEVLGLEAVAADDNFFALGGHSLLATRLASRVRQVLGVEMPVRWLFEAPDMAALAERIEAARRRRPALPLEPVPEGEPIPLSYPQERLWFLHQFASEPAEYNLPHFARLRGPLRVAAFAGALNGVVERHEILRSSFPQVEGTVVQRVAEAVPVTLPTVDLTGLPASEREAEAGRLSRREARRPFDFDRPGQLRAVLVRYAAADHLLMMSLHHIVSDAWSLSIFRREIAELYTAAVAGRRPALEPLELQYGDFAYWQRRWLEGEELDRQLGYWRHRLEGSSPLDLPTDRPRPAVRSSDGALHPVVLHRELTGALEKLSRHYGVTLFMTLLAAFKVLLHRYSGSTDINVGSPIANRNRVEVEGLIGVFINLLVLRSDLAGNPRFFELLEQVRDRALEAYDHQDIPFEKLVEEIAPERDLSRTPLFQVMLILQNAPSGTEGFEGLSLEPVTVDLEISKFDFTLSLEEIGGELRGILEYDRSLYDVATVSRLLGHLQVLLAGIAEAPTARLGDLPLLSGPELQQLLVGWNQTHRPFPRERLIHQGFESWAEARPDAEALVFEHGVFEHRVWSYAELNRRSNQLAHHLRALGVGPEDRVAIALERSPEMVMAILAVLKAGGAYVPLDPSFPRERLAFVLEDAGISVVVTRSETVPKLPPIPSERVSGELVCGELVCIDGDAEDISARDDDNPGPVTTADQLAYAIYTSGSTGRPKGVMVAHRNVSNFFTAMDEHLGEDPGVWLALTSISFDISVLELLWTLTRGFKVVIQGELGKTASLAGAESPAVSDRNLDFSLFYFASDDQSDDQDKYRLLLEGVQRADALGFSAVWTPERHFHAFGGLYPNPSVVSAAIAAVTEQIQIRAGSVVLPLQHPVRVAEEWSVVDNLSRGRVGLSFASGWHVNDFVFSPANYEDRKEIMAREIETVRKLWRGESITLPGGGGKDVELRIHPRPIQQELPVWVTAAGSPETFRMAGRLQAGLLTHLLGQDLAQLKQNIEIYREAWRESAGEQTDSAGAEQFGHVTLMLHAFVGEDLDRVREQVREPFCNYLKSSYGLFRQLALALGRNLDELSAEETEVFLNHAFERYFDNHGSFMGTPATCLEQAERLKAVGVDEVACLIDFGVDVDAALGSLELLDEVRRQSRRRSAEAASRPQDVPLAEQLVQHRVSHLQCTPSTARALAMEPEVLDAMSSLRYLLLGGEALPADLAATFTEVTTGSLLNMYGPTETTIWSTVETVTDPEGGVAIGRPVANTEVYVLDSRLRPVPVGVPGELWIGGEGVVRGYLDRPSLTAQRFIPNPFPTSGGEGSGGRLYRTGDRVRYRQDGVLSFLGRIDHQLKIRGHRIEPGEIESVLREHPLVSAAVVAGREDTPENHRLVGYVVPIESHRVLRPKVSAVEQKRLLADQSHFTLPNGMTVAVLSDFMAQLGYNEVFANNNYFRHGISLKPGDRVFDVGANVGFFTLFANQRCRGLHVHAFEPIPASFKALETNVELYGLDVEVHNCGMASESGEAEFTFYPYMSGLSSRYSDLQRDKEVTRAIMLEGLEQAGPSGAGEALAGQELDEVLELEFASETHTCALKTLSEVIREQNIEQIDLLKIDVERAELDVIQGIREEDWGKIRQLVLEVDVPEHLQRIREIVEGHGFHVVVEEILHRPATESAPEVFVAHLYASRSPLEAEPAADANLNGSLGGGLAAARAESDQSTLAVGELRSWLEDRLPEYMLPAAFVLLDALPTTPNGKIDLKALPAPEALRPEMETPFEAPSSEIQQAIAELWQNALGVERVGIHDNFFELGGNSLLLVVLRTDLREKLGHEVSLVDLFRHPTIASLARRLGRESPAEGAHSGARERAKKRRAVMKRRRSPESK